MTGLTNGKVCMPSSRTTRKVGVDVRLFPRLLGATSIVLLACNLLSAQVNTVRILGTVTDQSGGVVGNATVVVMNVQTGVARTLLCTQNAAAIGTAGPAGNLAAFGCYAEGNSVLIAPPTGTFGT